MQKSATVTNTKLKYGNIHKMKEITAIVAILSRVASVVLIACTQLCFTSGNRV